MDDTAMELAYTKIKRFAAAVFCRRGD